MDEQALLGLNPNADARYRQRVSRRRNRRFTGGARCHCSLQPHPKLAE